MNRRTRILALGFLATVTTSASAALPPRRVIVVARPGDPRAARQQGMLQHDLDALRDRDVVVEALTPDAARAQPALGVGSNATFELLLVGRDGGVKLRRTAPVTAAAITSLIDTMPMRQAEMRRRPPDTRTPP